MLRGPEDEGETGKGDCEEAVSDKEGKSGEGGILVGK